ncbi:hypothetical protein [Nonomuraea sp. SBT364]|uniref:hypothetical protein n=1 Tax=Nonomuraea sp. SBT364 TaxID=1580530 RepID=UPI00066DC109|nr:hypothetical protein [Nonomuraea sp. SBT364]
MTQNGSARQPAAADGRAGPRLNWPAVSALAALAAAVVALIAYLAPPAPPPQPQPQPEALVPTSAREPAPESALDSWSPDPDTSPPEPPAPDTSTPEPPMPSSTRAAPISSEALPPVRPGGCDEAATALTAYRRNAGAARSSQAAAAQQAYSDLMGAVLHAQGAVGAKISRLATEFRELNFRLTGMTGGDPNQVIADINTDVAELNRLCGAT